MEAKTLNCPMCGAPTSTEASNCAHCNARLAMVSCPSCFGMIFKGAQFCSHCGARAERNELPASTKLSCPRCKVALAAVQIGQTNLRECPKCQGLWVHTSALESICADREQQAAVLGVATPLPQSAVALEAIKYVPCPQCNRLMNRVNFANCSNVIVDVCKTDGTWFDKNELRRIVEFIRAGGFDKSRANQIAELERQKTKVQDARAAAAMESSVGHHSCGGPPEDLWIPAVAVAAVSILDSILD